MYVCMYVCIHTCVCVCVYIYTYIDILTMKNHIRNAYSMTHTGSILTGWDQYSSQLAALRPLVSYFRLHHCPPLLGQNICVNGCAIRTSAEPMDRVWIRVREGNVFVCARKSMHAGGAGTSMVSRACKPVVLPEGPQSDKHTRGDPPASIRQSGERQIQHRCLQEAWQSGRMRECLHRAGATQ